MARVVVDMMSDGQFAAPASAWESLAHACESGATWVSFQTTDGVEVLARVESIESVVFISDDTEQAIATRRVLESGA